MYKEKYLKYKNKYLKLKELVGGIAPPNETEQETDFPDIDELPDLTDSPTLIREDGNYQNKQNE